MVFRTKIFLGLLALLAPSTPALSLSPSWATYKTPPPQDVYKIAQYIETGTGQDLTLLAGGRLDQIAVGSVFRVYRPTVANQDPQGGASFNGEPLWIEMGQLKVIEVQDRYAMARIEKQGSDVVRALFPKFPEIMAGDLAVIQRVTIERRPLVLPNVAVSYFDLFADPNGQPDTFELTTSGADKIKELAQSFAKARLSMLMIEGYTDSEGRSESNQVESYQRALTIRQFLIDELGFDESRVVAVGYGEQNPVDRSLAPGSKEANRRIVFKAVPAPGTP